MSRIGDRLAAWSEDRIPVLHTFLTHEGKGWSAARTAASLAIIGLLGFAVLWGGTGQSIGEPPIVVVESGSMMHCDGQLGTGLQGSACGRSSLGRLGTIEAGDLVFVRDVDEVEDIATFAEDGKERHGLPGDVVVYLRAGQPPIIHRAMFWLEVHDDGTYSIPELGLDHVDTLDQPVLRDEDRWGLDLSHGTCRGLSVSSNAESGWITKGDNNPCWDQGSSLRNTPIQLEEIVGKARGEIPWIGLLKLFVFDLLGGQLDSGNYAAAPGDLKVDMWIAVGVLVGGPYVVEQVMKRRAEKQEGAEEEEGAEE